MAPSAVHELVNRMKTMAEDIAKEAQILGPPEPEPKCRTLAAGAVAGLVVDGVLFPLDTVKSRLQSKAGFYKSGGFSHLYRGLPPVLAGSVPNAALFFLTYETIKDKLHHYKVLSPRGNAHLVNHVIAATMGEAVSCAIRVPYEVIKMRSQTGAGKPVGNLNILKGILASEGFFGLYRGFSSTVMRDVPFSAIQFPVWERLKLNHLRKNKRPATAVESACYGALAGALAALATTPLDVAKTRIMLAGRDDPLASGKIGVALRAIKQEKGLGGLFAGVVPRVMWISVGAFIFLGSYEKAIKVLTR